MTDTHFASSLAEAISSLATDNGRVVDGQTFVKLLNKGRKPFVFKYANRTTIIPPGSERLVPFSAAVLYCGDPRALDNPNDKRDRFRTAEYLRLRVLYGVYEQDLNLTNFPDIEMYAPDGTRIPTVLEDPNGEFFNATVSHNDAEEKHLRRTVDALRAQLDMTLQRLAEQTGENLNITTSPVVSSERPDDMPVSTAPVIEAEDLLRVKPTTTVVTGK